MSDRIIKDLEYAAVRFNSKINSKVVSDLYSHGAVKDMDDLTPDGIFKIRAAIKEYDLQPKTIEAVENAYKSNDRIREILIIPICGDTYPECPR